MKILIACEFSGIVRDAFTKFGHEAYSCDVLPTESPGKHLQCDVLEILGLGWDMMIAHPPCTYLTNSGVCWLHKDPDRWSELDKGAEFFRALLESDIERIAIENPIPHKYALERIGRSYDQMVQPWWFGHTEQKATCFWLKNLPKLHGTNVVYKQMMKLSVQERQRIHYTPPGKDRWKVRSRTFTGLAKAMADQWGSKK